LGRPCSSIFHTAQKCADCDIKDTLSFNATGFIDVFDALSCTERYAGVEATNNMPINGRKTAAPAAAAATTAPASTPVAAASTPAPAAVTPATAAAAPADGDKASTAYVVDYEQKEVTIYRGTATTIEAEVTSVTSYGYGYESDVEELVKGAKVYYVGGFLPSGETIVRPTEELPDGVPFVTGGSFQIELKKKY
jgi:outer membrane receptor protein involved in Fe transport